MSIDDVIMSEVDDRGERCVVCGKSVVGGGGYTRIRYEKEMVALCCPLCLKTFQANPQEFVRRQDTRAEVHAIFDLLHTKPPAESGAKTKGTEGTK
jgi:hypothetical protein